MLWNYESESLPTPLENRYWRQAEGILNAAIASYMFMNIKIQDGCGSSGVMQCEEF